MGMIATEMLSDSPCTPREIHGRRRALTGSLTSSAQGRTTQWCSKTLLGRPNARGVPPDPARVGARELTTTDAGELVRQVRERVRALALSRSVEVIDRVACSPLWVQPRPFASAIGELVKNAVEASRRDTFVLVEACDTGDGDVLWQIQDTGQGIAGRALANLGHPPRHLGRGRAGRGVEYAWAVVEAHGGLLHFESAVGVGTTATVWLPGR